MSRAQHPILCPHPQNAVVWARPRLESSVWNPPTHARNTHFTDQGGKCGRGEWAAQAERRGPGQGQVTVALRAARPVEGKPPKALLRCSVGPRSRKDKPGGGGTCFCTGRSPLGSPCALYRTLAVCQAAVPTVQMDTEARGSGTQGLQDCRAPALSRRAQVQARVTGWEGPRQAQKCQEFRAKPQQSLWAA